MSPHNLSPICSPLLWPVVQVLGLHLHSDDATGMNHSHDDHEEGSQDYIYKLLVVMAGIYVFFIMESIFAIISNGHGHHHEVRKEVAHLLNLIVKSKSKC